MLHFVSVKIGDRIRAARAKAGMTQRSLAMRLGVDKSAVAQWEGGGGGSGIKTSNLIELARILGVRPSELLGEPTPADHMTLDDTDEIALLVLYRRLPARQRGIYRQLLEIGIDRGHFSDDEGNVEERRRVAS